MSRSDQEKQETEHLEVRGVDARRLGGDTASLGEMRAGTKARLSRQSLQFFLIALAAVLLAISAVVAVVGVDRLI